MRKQRHGINETSWRGRYHNQRFKAIAGEFGLEVSADPPYGSSATSASRATMSVCATAVDALDRGLRAREPPRPVPTGITSLMCRCGRRSAAPGARRSSASLSAKR